LNIENGENYYNKIEPSICSLFWFSVVWRYSLVGQLRLSTRDQNTLREILDKFLLETQDNFDTIRITDAILRNNIQYTLLRSPNINQKKGTLIFHHTAKYSPYFIMIDEFIIGIKIHTNCNNKLFLGVEQFFNSEFDNRNEQKEHIRVIPAQKYLNVIEQTIGLMSTRSLKAIIKIVDQLYRKVTNQDQRMPNELKIRILNKIVFDDIPMGQKYTIEHILNHTLGELIGRN